MTAAKFGRYDEQSGQTRDSSPNAATDRLCPCCRGTKGRWQHFEVLDAPESWDHTDSGGCECGPEFVDCLCCEGTGEVVGLRRATLLARGDIAPVQLRGHA